MWLPVIAGLAHRRRRRNEKVAYLRPVVEQAEFDRGSWRDRRFYTKWARGVRNGCARRLVKQVPAGKIDRRMEARLNESVQFLLVDESRG
jgi:hypothetical protein